MIQFESKFEIGEKIYHVLPESPVGIIVDVTYRHSTGIVYYEIQWDPEQNSTICREFELTREKNVI
jgi:hypothetical protein